jgi:hypothetical protein
MKTLLLIGIVAIVAAVLALIARTKSSGTNETSWPFCAKKPLTNSEQILYWRLLKALPDHMVLAQVGLSRMLEVKGSPDFHAWNNRIDRKSADFVICGKDASIFAVIELDDATHERANRKYTDDVKDKALRAAGIRVVRWQAKSMPDDAAIRETFRTVAPAATLKSPPPEPKTNS